MCVNKPDLELRPNDVSPEARKNMGIRTITTIVLLAVTIPCIILGGWFFFGLVIVIAFLAAYELVRASKPPKALKIAIYVATFVFILLFTFWIFMRDSIAEYMSDPTSESFVTGSFLQENFSELKVSTILVIFAAAFYFFLALLDGRCTLLDALYYFGMSLVIGICLEACLYLRYLPSVAFKDAFNMWNVDTPYFMYLHSALLFFYVLVANYINDTAAYFIGLLFGKHKVNERVSPKKTWEGFFGGIVVSFACSLVFAYAAAGAGKPLLPFLDLEHWYWPLLISLVIPFAANLGDFTLSEIKRNFKIKDYGSLLPGHGGMLDRVDSMLFSAAAAAILISLISGGYEFFALL